MPWAQRNGVQEYLAWVVREQRVSWFRLREGHFAALNPDSLGVLHSEVFPGLRLHVPKVLAGDWLGVLDELRPSAG